MTNVTLSTDPSVAETTLSFSLTGQSGTSGFGNITIPKSAITNTTTSTVPLVLIDGAQALNQSYTQDATNFYVSYTCTSAHIQYPLFLTQVNLQAQLLNPLLLQQWYLMVLQLLPRPFH